MEQKTPKSKTAAASTPPTTGMTNVASPGRSSNGLVLPMNRVKNMVKGDIDVKTISGEAVFAVTKATELILEAATTKAGQHMHTAGVQELEYDHIAQVVADWEALDEFLADIVPKKITVAEAMEQMKQMKGEKE